MKFFVIAAAILIVGIQALSEEQKQKLLEYSKECQKLSKASDQVIADARKGIYADDPQLRAQTLCLSKKLGFQNEKGEFQLDVIRNKLTLQSIDYVSRGIDKCVGEKPAEKVDPELTAFETMKCISKLFPRPQA